MLRHFLRAAVFAAPLSTATAVYAQSNAIPDENASNAPYFRIESCPFSRGIAALGYSEESHELPELEFSDFCIDLAGGNLTAFESLDDFYLIEEGDGFQVFEYVSISGGRKNINVFPQWYVSHPQDENQWKNTQNQVAVLFWHPRSNDRALRREAAEALSFQGIFGIPSFEGSLPEGSYDVMVNGFIRADINDLVEVTGNQTAAISATIDSNEPHLLGKMEVGSDQSFRLTASTPAWLATSSVAEVASLEITGQMMSGQATGTGMFEIKTGRTRGFVSEDWLSFSAPKGEVRGLAFGQNGEEVSLIMTGDAIYDTHEAGSHNARIVLVIHAIHASVPWQN